MDVNWTTIENLLPHNIAQAVKSQQGKIKAGAEEIRLRTGKLPTLLLPEGEFSFGESEIVWNDLAYVLDRASRSSLHAVAKELRQGYISAGGGIRIGVCGRYSSGGIESFQDVSSLSIRIPREVKGAGESAIRLLFPFDCSVLIVSPPGGGKTTFLRELICCASNAGRRIALCDERNEVAAMWKGKPSFDLGRYTDILCGAPKAEGIMMLLRSMNPEIIAVDEISSEEDVRAVEHSAGCGALFFASVHGCHIKELRKRPALNSMLDMGIFRKAVVISGREKRNYELVNL